MVICFEEKDRAVIEGKGMTVIEFKRRLYNMGNTIDDTLKILKECADKIAKVWNVFIEKFFEAVDSVKLVFEQISDAYHHPASCRYRIVKIFSKCTGTDICFNWKITYKIKRRLSRS